MKAPKQLAGISYNSLQEIQAIFGTFTDFVMCLKGRAHIHDTKKCLKEFYCHCTNLNEL